MKTIAHFFTIVFFLFGSLNIFSQGVAINTNGTAADNSAMLDVSSTSKGILIPRMDIAQRNLIGTPETGLLIYQTDGSPGFYFYNGSSWVVVGSESMSINDLSDGKAGGNSVFLGSGAGAVDNGSNNYNVGVGNDALNKNTTGLCNTAIGMSSLYSNTGGRYNIAIGKTSLYNSTTGNFNVAVGSESLKYNTTGCSNTTIGDMSLYSSTTGNYNAAVGAEALFINTSGGHNTAIGSLAGYSNNGSGNVFLGYQAGKDESNSNKLYIENSESGSPLIYGEFDNNLLKFNGSLELANGTSASSLKFYEPSGSGSNYTRFLSQAQTADVTYTLPAADGTDGQILNTNGSGSLSWANDATGATSINGLSDGKSDGYSVFLGSNSGNSDDGSNNNTGLGLEALYSNISGEHNTAIGRYALHSNTASQNVAIGSSALDQNTSGQHNTAVGRTALYSNTEGSQNTVVGADAGSNCGSSISGSVFLGYQAGKNESSSNKLYIENSESGSPLIYGEFDNDLVRINGDFEVTGTSNISINNLTDGKSDAYSVFLGSNSGNSDNGSNNNTGLGIEALYSNISGEHNTAIGRYALHSNTDSHNVAIGSSALDQNTSGHHNTAVGRSALYVNTEGSQNTAIGADAGTSDGYDNLGNTGAFGYNVKVSASNYFRIGNTSVSFIGGQVGWSTYSDGRFKTNINENVQGLDFILKLRPLSFHWDIQKLDKFMGASEGVEKSETMREARKQQEAKVYTGFLAQEVEQAAEEIGFDFSGVETPPNDKTPYSIRYAEFVVPLVKAVQEQQQMITEQLEMIKTLQKQNKELIERIKKIEEK